MVSRNAAKKHISSFFISDELVGKPLKYLSFLEDLPSGANDIVNFSTDIIIKAKQIINSYNNQNYIIIHCLSLNPNFNSAKYITQNSKIKEYYIFITLEGRTILNYNPTEFNPLLELLKSHHFYPCGETYIMEYMPDFYESQSKINWLIVPQDYLFE